MKTPDQNSPPRTLRLHTPSQYARFFISMYRRNPYVWPNIGFSFLFCFGVVALAYVVALVFAVPQSLRLGLGAAWRHYGKLWVMIPPVVVVSITIVVVLGMLLSEILVVVVLRLFFYRRRYTSEEVGRHTSNVAWVLSGLFAIVAWGVPNYYEAGSPPPRVGAADQKTLTESKEAIAHQGESVRELSASAEALLVGLDKTEGDLRGAKESVKQSLVKLAEQQRAVRAAGDALQKILEQEETIEAQHEELRRILGGKTPITNDDLVNATSSGHLRGVIESFVISFLAGWFLWVWTERRRRRREATSLPLVAGPPPRSGGSEPGTPSAPAEN